ncbi:metal dependent phosphohydrolase [Moniliophthora roreri MCA 2997]|uniref:Metal dependent phosphohydrolase n=1 Tax=Moniliophthora roreri (strain MCA 2997) TaxID=1381753 RepID=V2XM79_MONRO|nr:metal dependent phosphohydrolase [Moniliophthora roreri MCA 2997]
MYPTPDEKVYIDVAEKLMVETMARYDPSHDAYHVQRVRKTALAIANALLVKPDLLVVELAALLHDVLDKKYVTAEQAADPFTFFVPLFKGAAQRSSIDLIADGRARLITQIIENVSWTTEKRLRASGLWGKWHDECLELHCVQDADRLDAIGAFGVLRCAAYTSATNNPLHTPANDPALEASAIQHFHDKLVHIKDRLKTTPGKKLGEKRHKLIVDFIAAVQEEYDIPDINS